MLKRLLPLLAFVLVLTGFSGWAVLTHDAPVVKAQSSPDDYYPDGDGDGIPDSIESDLTSACGAFGNHTYHLMWFHPYLITPAYGTTTYDVQVRSVAYICPGVSYFASYNIYHEMTGSFNGTTGAADPISFPWGQGLWLGTAQKGWNDNFSSLAIQTVRLDLTKLAANQWNYIDIYYKGEGYPGGVYDCFQQTTVPPAWATCTPSAATLAVYFAPEPPPPTYWNYSIGLTGTAAGTYKPDTVLSMGNDVTNIQSGPGQNYTNTLSITSGSGAISPSSGASWGEGGLGGYWSRSRSISRTIRRSATHGTSICHRSTISPSAGQSTPTSTVTSWSRSTGTRCYTVYNRRFGVADPTVTPNRLYVLPGDSVDFQFNFCNSDTGLAQFNGYTGATHFSTPSSGAMPQLTMRPLGTLSGSPDTVIMPSTGRNGCRSYTRTYTVPLTATPGQTFCARGEVNLAAGWSDGAGSYGGKQADSCTPSDEVTVVAAPYLRTTGSDVIAGAKFSPTSTPTSPVNCSTIFPVGAGDGSRNAILKSHTLVSGSKVVGSTSDYGGFATGKIRGWGTGGGWLRYGRFGYSQSFRNADAAQADLAATTNQRGFFRTNPLCTTNLHDYLEKTVGGNVLTAPVVGGVLNAGAMVNGRQYVHNGNLTINGFDLGARRMTLIVTGGDVTINGNIFTNYAVSDYKTIPIFTLVTNETIVIGNAVTRLDGIYAAVNNATGNGANPLGQIETCVANRTNWAMNSCNSKLTVNGMLIARRINFWRTSDTISGTVPANEQARAAEWVRFNSELYLGRPILIPDDPKSSTSGVGDIDQLKDLPAVR